MQLLKETGTPAASGESADAGGALAAVVQLTADLTNCAFTVALESRAAAKERFTKSERDRARWLEAEAQVGRQLAAGGMKVLRRLRGEPTGSPAVLLTAAGAVRGACGEPRVIGGCVAGLPADHWAPGGEPRPGVGSPVASRLPGGPGVTGINVVG